MNDNLVDEKEAMLPVKKRPNSDLEKMECLFLPLFTNTVQAEPVQDPSQQVFSLLFLFQKGYECSGKSVKVFFANAREARDVCPLYSTKYCIVLMKRREKSVAAN